MFNGVYTALITPFKESKLDFDSFEKIIEFQIKNGVSGLIPCGTTGESPSLTEKEYKDILQFTVDIVRKRVKIIAGAGSNSTAKTISNALYAKGIGVDCVLIVSPYYNKPSQMGIFKHYKAVSDNADIPIMIYDIPSRTGVSISAETILELSRDRNIVALKESSGDLDKLMYVISNADKHFSVLSGDDSMTLPLMSLGARGVVSVLSNLIPAELVRFFGYCMNGDYVNARDLHYFYIDLINVLFVETNPVPVKYVMSILGNCLPDVRMPLCQLNKESVYRVRQVLKKHAFIRD